MRQAQDNDFDTNEFNVENTEEFLIEEEFGGEDAGFHDYDDHDFEMHLHDDYTGDLMDDAEIDATEPPRIQTVPISPLPRSMHPRGSLSSPSNSCRICRLNHGPLCHPCKCSGSIKYVHEECLLRWLEAKYGSVDVANMVCEVCGERFRFRKVYAENAPKQLSPTQFLRGLGALLLNTLIKIIRPIFVLCVWFILVPCITGFLWNLYFKVNREKYEVFSIFGWDNLVPWLVDGVCGSCVCVAIILCCFLIAAFKEFIGNNPDLIPQLPFVEEQAEAVPQEDDPNAPQVANLMHGDQFPHLEPANNLPLDGDAPEPAILPNEATIEQLLGFEGPIRNLFESFIIAFIFIVASLNLFVFVPYTAGFHIDSVIIGLGSRQTRARATPPPNEELSFLSHCLILSKGYTIQAAGFLLWTLVATLFQHFFHQRDANNHYLNNAVYYTKLVYMFFKVVALVVVNFVLTPIILGLMVNFATASFFDVTVESRIQSLLKASSFISLSVFHFVLGMMVLLNSGSIVRTLRTFLRNDVLWFLSNPDDPQYHYFRNVVQNSPLVHLRRLLMTLILFSILILAVVRTPLKFVRQVYPSFFPLVLPHHSSWSSEILFNFDMLFIFILPQMGISALWVKMSPLIQKWIEIVSEPLGLKDYFFDHRPNRAEFDSDDEEQAIDSIRVEDPSQIKWFPLRIASFLIITWCTCIVIVSILFPLPIILGRFVLLSIGLELSDFCTWLCGYYLLQLTRYLVMYIYHQIQTLQMMDLLRTVAQYMVVCLKLCVLGLLWFIMLASLLGLCFYVLFLFPFFPLDLHPRPPNDHFLSVGWMIGSVISQLAWISNDGSFLHTYRREMQRIRRDGWLNVNMTRILRNLILPWYIGMTLFLYIPAFVARYVVPLVLYRGLGLPIAEVVMKQQLVKRYSNILIFTVVTSVFAVKKLARISHQLYEKVFDQQFVIRRTLENVAENIAPSPTPSSSDLGEMEAAEIDLRN